MNPVSRREFHHPSATDLSVPANTSTRRDPGKQQATATGAQTNHLESYRSPAVPPRSLGAGAPAGTRDEEGLTVGQLALDEARRAAYADLRAALLTHSDARRVHEQLESLPPADYRGTLERMEQDGLLGKYLDLERMSPEARMAFLSQAERKGIVTREPEKKAPPAVCEPPDVPTTYRNEAALPSSLRELIHESNRMAKRTYHDAHDAYVKRYSERVMQARSLLELRSLGEPVAPFKVSDGLVHPHPDSKRFRESWSKVRGNDTRDDAYEAVSHRMAQLSGQQRPGSFWFKAEVGLKGELGGVGFTAGAEVLVAQDGQAKWAPRGGVEVGAKGLEGSAEFSESGAPKVTVGLEHAGAGISADSEGALRLELPAGRGFASHAELNPKEGTYGGGVAFRRKVGEEGEAKVSVGFGMQGARRERARDVASNAPGTLFGALPELDQGLAWKELPAERRARMERDGWTSEQWSEALRRKASKR